MGGGFGEYFVFYDLVGCDDLQSCSVGLNEFVGDGEGNLLVGRGSDGNIATKRSDCAVSIAQLNDERVAAGANFDVDSGEGIPGGGISRAEEGELVALPLS